MKITVYVLNGLFQFCLWFQIALVVCEDAMVVPLPRKTGMDNVPFTSGLHNQSKLLRSPPTEMSCLHVIFYFNRVLVVKRAFRFLYANANQFYACI